jgi:hypothetical protein
MQICLINIIIINKINIIKIIHSNLNNHNNYHNRILMAIMNFKLIIIQICSIQIPIKI